MKKIVFKEITQDCCIHNKHILNTNENLQQKVKNSDNTIKIKNEKVLFLQDELRNVIIQYNKIKIKLEYYFVTKI